MGSGPSTNFYPPESVSAVYHQVDQGLRRKRMTHLSPNTRIPGLLPTVWARRNRPLPPLLISLHIQESPFLIQLPPCQLTNQHPPTPGHISPLSLLHLLIPFSISFFLSPSPHFLVHLLSLCSAFLSRPSRLRLLVSAFSSPPSGHRLLVSPPSRLCLPCYASPSLPPWP